MSEHEGEKVYEAKCIVVGDPGTGKTCIVQRLAFDNFLENPDTTISASSFLHVLQYGNTTLKMEIWDTAGQELYMSLNKIFFKGAKIVILTYDITRKESFDAIETLWLKQTKECVDPNAVLCIAANKSDRYNEEQVTEDEAKQYAEKIGALYMQTSALQGTGIKELFKEVGKKYLEKIGTQIIVPDENKKDNKTIVHLNKEKVEKEKDRKKCC